MKPVVIEIVAPVLGFLVHCPHCEMMSNQGDLWIGDKVHNQEINEYPEDLREEYLHVSNWVRDTYSRFGSQVRIKIIDPQSLAGMWRYLRYGVRSYPTFMLEGEPRFAGWESAEQVLQQVDAMLAGRRLVVE